MSEPRWRPLTADEQREWARIRVAIMQGQPRRASEFQRPLPMTAAVLPAALVLVLMTQMFFAMVGVG